VFREGWTDNADVMSYLYTGTPALKTDFTRTGARTYRGAMNDGINSITRYYINNFTDGYYHDCLDVATAKLTAKSELKSRSFISPLKMTIFMVCVATLFSKFVIEETILRGVQPDDYTTKQLVLHSMVVFGTFIAGVYSILNNGRNYIDDCTRYV